MLGSTPRRYRRLSRPFQALALILLAGASVGGNTQFTSPPRFDGAGYAMLAKSLASGLGYREGSHPDLAPHTHFPPGYPFVLSLLFRATGRSSAADAHLLSAVATVLAVLVYWVWFRKFYTARTAFVLGAALALNWTWGRTGGAIQSEPIFILLSGAAILLAETRRRPSCAQAVLVGLVLGACILTRYVGACLAVAIAAYVLLRSGPRPAIVTLLAAAVPVVSWALRLHHVGQGSQARLLPSQGLVELVIHQTWFYLQRIPDHLTGPFVEIALVFARSRLLAIAASVWAVLASALVLWGWKRAIRTPRQRLAGLGPLCTFPLLLIWPFTEAGRFLIPLVPFILVGATEGGARFLAALGIANARRRAAAIILLAALPYAGYALVTGRAKAQEQTHHSFDLACRWIAESGDQPGPVLTRYPADVFWQTGRRAFGADSHDLKTAERNIDHYRVAYLIVDRHPFANAQDDPLLGFVASHSARLRLVHGDPDDVAIYAVAHTPRPSVPDRPGSAGSRSDMQRAIVSQSHDAGARIATGGGSRLGGRFPTRAQKVEGQPIEPL